jgi:UDP-glucose 4-epimerase
MRIAIIGGAGFIGSAIAQLLSKHNIELSIFDTKKRLDKLLNIRQQFNTTLFPYPKVKDLHRHFTGYDALIHLAYTTEPASSMDSLVFDARTNIVPSLEIFQAAIDAGITRIIFSSSGGTVYGDPVSLPVVEDDEKKPLCAYGVSKLAIEQYLHLYAINNSIKGISLRLANPYGTFQLQGTRIGIIAHFLNDIKNHNPLNVYGDGSIVRDYFHIDCAAKAFFSALFSSSLPSGSYNIGSGIGVSINELIDLLFKITGQKVSVNYIHGRSFDVPKIFLDSSRFKSFTSWQPEISLEEGIAKMWDHYK